MLFGFSIVSRQLVSALEVSQRFSDYQFGFCKGRSPVSLLLTTINDWSLSLERRSNTHCVFLDFAKVFDSVPQAEADETRGKAQAVLTAIRAAHSGGAQ